MFENYVLLSLILLIDIDLLSDIHEIWKLQNLREIHFYATSTATLWKNFFKNFAILVEGFCFQSAYYGITIVRGGDQCSWPSVGSYALEFTCTCNVYLKKFSRSHYTYDRHKHSHKDNFFYQQTLPPPLSPPSPRRNWFQITPPPLLWKKEENTINLIQFHNMVILDPHKGLQEPRYRGHELEGQRTIINMH